jgi:hypothetical protein
MRKNASLWKVRKKLRDPDALLIKQFFPKEWPDLFHLSLVMMITGIPSFVLRQAVNEVYAGKDKSSSSNPDSLIETGHNIVNVEKKYYLPRRFEFKFNDCEGLNS